MSKIFYSQLFRKYIYPDDKEYWAKVHAELLYRIDYLESRKCSCFQCNAELKNFKEYLEKLKVRLYK